MDIDLVFEPLAVFFGRGVDMLLLALGANCIFPQLDLGEICGDFTASKTH